MTESRGKKRVRGGAWDGLTVAEQLLAAAEKRLCVRLVFYDLSGLIHDGRGRSLLPPDWHSHRRIPVCGVGFNARRCVAHCRGSVIAEAVRRQRPFRHCCWKGVEEVVVPLLWRGEVRALLMAGSWRRAARPATADGLSASWAREYRKLELLAAETERELARVLESMGLGLLAGLEADVLGPPAQRSGTRRDTIMQFLRYHACGRITLSGLAAVLHLTPSRTSHVVTELCGAPFQELVREERMRRARVLLDSTDLTAGEIAARVGMDNEYHFNRMFRREHGLPPGKFRKQADANKRAGA